MLDLAEKSHIEGTVHIATGSKLGFHSVGTAADGTSLCFFTLKVKWPNPE